MGSNRLKLLNHQMEDVESKVLFSDFYWEIWPLDMATIEYIWLVHVLVDTFYFIVFKFTFSILQLEVPALNLDCKKREPVKWQFLLLVHRPNILNRMLYLSTWCLFTSLCLGSINFIYCSESSVSCWDVLITKKTLIRWCNV